MRINNVYYAAYTPSSRLPIKSQATDSCNFSGRLKLVEELVPTEEEIKGVIAHLPKDAQEAAITARKDVKDMAMQVVRLVRTGEITSVDDDNDYMGDYAELGKKVFDKMTPEQKAQSIMLQEKAIEEMQNVKSIASRSVKEKLLRDLVDAQIQMSRETLEYCKKYHR